MASPIQQQSRVPYETAKDCSQGFCSVYCPQWCYIIFPPPPPFSFVDDDDDSSGSTAFSPLVIAIIGILASAFLLVTYYTVVSKYCGGFRRGRSNRNPISPDDHADDDDDDDGDQSQRHEAGWHVPSSNGLDQSLINKISVYKYKRGDGVVDGTDCSVCLGEFREDESLRLLPKCSHAFHLQCIDTWLSSHSNCPLCRANIVSVHSAPPPQLPAPPPPPPPPLPEPNGTTEGEQSDEMAVFIEDSGEETNSEVSDDDMPKEENHHIIEVRDGGGGGGGAQPIRRSFSLDSSNLGRVSIADILQQSMEDELMMEKDRGSCSSSRGENSKSSRRSRSLHSVMSPIPMKRSVSSGRFGLARQVRGRINAVLPM